MSCDDRDIAPGEKGTITVTFTFLQRYGNNVKKVRVVNSDKTIDTLILEVNIPQLFALTPDKVSWKIGDEPVEKSMRLKVRGKKKVFLKNALSDHRRFESTIKEIIPGVEYEITATPVDTTQKSYALVSCETDMINPATRKPKKIDLRFYVQ